MKALTIRPQWAHAVIFLGKWIENRTWETAYRGPLLIHASQNMTAAEYQRFAEFVEERRLGRVPSMGEIMCGGVIGRVTLVGFVRNSPSRWFVGPVGWILSDAKPLDFVAAKGALGIFNLPGDARHAVDQGR